jgi:hypothetical protein
MNGVNGTTEIVFLFQYGSNMSSTRLNSTDRLDGAARKVGPAKLEGWGIRFELFGLRTHAESQMYCNHVTRPYSVRCMSFLVGSLSPQKVTGQEWM